MTNSLQKLIFGVFVSIIIIFGATNAVFSQNNSSASLTNFKMLVETTDDGINLTCKEGCAWKDLTFRLKKDNSQVVDQFGMTTISTDKPIKERNLGVFLIKIKKTNEGISLEGLKGTSFTKLSFSYRNNKCYQYIDQNGMTNPE